MDQQLEWRRALEEYSSLNQNQDMLWGFESTMLHMLPCHHVITPRHHAKAFLGVIALTFHIILNHIAYFWGRRCRSVVKILQALKDAETCSGDSKTVWRRDFYKHRFPVDFSSIPNVHIPLPRMHFSRWQVSNRDF